MSHELRRLVERLPLPASLGPCDDSGKIFLVNDAFVRIFGWTLEDIPTVRDWALKAYPDEAYRQETFAAWNQAFEKAKSYDGRLEAMEFRVTCKDGTVRDVVISSAVLENFQMVTFVDVTQWRRAEAHRRTLEQKLRQSLTAAATAHEIKQPLARIMMHTQTMIERLQEKPFEAREIACYLEEMLGQSRQLASLIDSMRLMLRNTTTHFGPVRIDDVVRSAILYCRTDLADRGIMLAETGLEQSVVLEGDAVQLQIAVVNLLRNAVDAVSEVDQGPRQIAIELITGPSEVVVVVGDGGEGMSDEQLAALPLSSNKPDGIGLGFYIAGVAAENHGGRLIVGRSCLGGAEVRLVLPVIPKECKQ